MNQLCYCYGFTWINTATVIKFWLGSMGLVRAGERKNNPRLFQSVEFISDRFSMFKIVYVPGMMRDA